MTKHKPTRANRYILYNRLDKLAQNLPSRLRAIVRIEVNPPSLLRLWNVILFMKTVFETSNKGEPNE